MPAIGKTYHDAADPSAWGMLAFIAGTWGELRRPGAAPHRAKLADLRRGRGPKTRSEKSIDMKRLTYLAKMNGLSLDEALEALAD